MKLQAKVRHLRDCMEKRIKYMEQGLDELKVLMEIQLRNCGKMGASPYKALAETAQEAAELEACIQSLYARRDELVTILEED